ncbi:MAG TPA: redoxin domain-containing protein [Solirubrobacteraceae bacterium]|jgi:cytochrome oxidase Cu insertion factor (SCO1/SenC/PrrC family)/thiol-disulfide isomerase/thioredoxin|nr:redoxin domain-containing protein [Solirubrobacteraceae bacterium]
MTETQRGPAPRRPWRRPATAVALAFLLAALVVVIAIAIGPAKAPVSTQQTLLDTNPDLDPGTKLHGQAPNFTLTDQFGRPQSLRALRGHVVILAFNDSQCTTVCPLTTAAMVEAKGLLGAAGGSVDLVGINANPKATAVHWVRAYSQAHGMLHQWKFLTGSLAQLRGVWRAFHIDVQIEAGQIDHTAALYVIDGRGHYAKVYVTAMAYSSVDQQAQILAREVSALLPGHPKPRSALSYQRIPPISPTSNVALPRSGGGKLEVGPAKGPRLYLFFASWLTEITPLGAQLDALRQYAAIAPHSGLAPLTAIDEGSVEPSQSALPRFLATLRKPLSYPLAIDRTGRVADGYLVEDQPWFVLVSRSGRTLWYWDVSTQGWLTTGQLAKHVSAALSAPAKIKIPAASQASKVLAGSPPPLAALHRQAGRLLPVSDSLAARLRALRGFPVVLNVWASWCTGCQAEYPYFAAAAVHYGRQVAFVGVDASDDDSAGEAQGYLSSHPLSYPSYQLGTAGLDSITGVGIYALPTTFFIDRAGRIVCRVRTGQYDSQGALDGDIQSCAIGQ